MNSQSNILISNDALERKRAELRLRGVNVSKWASEREFSREMVYAVLHGRARAHRGQAHEIARSLGLIPSLGLSQAREGGGEAAS
jgi:gp16 family phage-associated protein